MESCIKYTRKRITNETDFKSFYIFKVVINGKIKDFSVIITVR